MEDEKLAWARDFSTAYEAGVKYTKVTSDMDLHNNNVGLRYYDSKTSRTYTTVIFKFETGVSEPSYDTAATEIRNRAKNATLVNRGALGDSTTISRINAVGADTLVYVKVDNNTY